MINYFYLYKIYKYLNEPEVIFIRLLIIFSFPVFYFVFGSNPIAKLLIIPYGFMLMSEIFIAFKINREIPHKKVNDTDYHFEETMKFSTLLLFEDAKNVYSLVSLLVHKKENIFILEKIGPGFNLSPKELQKKEILAKAVELVKDIKGKYVSEIDLFVAYLLLCEDEAKYFQANDLKLEDVINITYWARNKFQVDALASNDLTFKGQGFGEFFIEGWDYEIKKYSLDLTRKVLSERFPPIIIGRKNEYNELLNILSKEHANNIILIGEPGLGKTTLVEYFAYQSHLDNTPKMLSGRRVYELFVDRLIAGANESGEVERRLEEFFSDIIHSGNVILFIQNIENIFGGGGLSFDISGIIFEFLKNSRIQIIGTATNSSYKTFIENKSAVSNLFETVKLEEPNQKDAVFMLFEKIGQMEYQYGVIFTYNSITEAVKLSSSYLLDRYLPGKAIDLLSEVASKSKLSNTGIVDKDDVIKKVEEKTKILISEPSKNEKEVLLHLEDEIHKRIIDQKQAVKAISEALRRLRSGFINKKRPISVFLFLGPTGVGKTETAKALASIYFGSESKMIRLDMSEYQTQESIKRLLGALPGEEISAISFTDKAKENPFSLILLDEFEKAHPRILDLFLQVFDDGRLTDNRGHTVSFTNTIIIATSNAGSELIREKIEKGIDILSFKKDLLDYLQKQQIMRPELINRFDDIIVFKPLGEEEISQISGLILKDVLKLLEEKQITVGFDQKVIEKIKKESFDMTYGARNVRRYITDHVEGFLSRMMLEDKIIKGDKKMLTVDEKGEITLI